MAQDSLCKQQSGQRPAGVLLSQKEKWVGPTDDVGDTETPAKTPSQKEREEDLQSWCALCQPS